MQDISIQASDTLFFRDGRPFSMTEDNYAQGVFPPNPSVIYGALRAAYISNDLENGQNLESLIEESEKLRISFMALKVASDTYFHLPKDLIVPKDKKKKRPVTEALMLDNAPVASNSKTPKVLRSPLIGKAEIEPHFVDLPAFQNYLNGDGNGLLVRKISEFITYEPKIGIGRDKNSNTAENGKFFRTQSNRLANGSETGIRHLQFLLKIDGILFPESSWLTLGGDRRVAFCKKDVVFEMAMPEISSTIFKIYLATPAVFAAGWKPKELLEKYELSLITAAIDRPVHVGGWDMEKNRPKPMVQAVPSGSVFYVEAKSVELAREVAGLLHGKSITENINGIDYQAQGFGISYVAKINN